MGLVAASAVAIATAALPGTWTNEEQVSFAREGGGPVPPWEGFVITATGDGFSNQSIDPLGAPIGPARSFRLIDNPGGVAIESGACIRPMLLKGEELVAAPARGRCDGPAAIQSISPGAIRLALATGQTLDLRRARPFTCWAAVPKRAKKPDGTLDWWGARNLATHDQGGRVAIATDEPEPQRFELRMRNVVWPTGPNRPSLVLYVHTPEGGDRAIGYSWADPEAKRVGINVRSIQASCSRAQREMPSAQRTVTPGSTRGPASFAGE
jgi:hypothetical protein